MSKEQGGQAFPYMDDIKTYPVRAGMTLRDYFAAQALPGILYMVAHGAHGAADSPEGTAKEAYLIADAMLAVRHAG